MTTSRSSGKQKASTTTRSIITVWLSVGRNEYQCRIPYVKIRALQSKWQQINTVKYDTN